MFSTVNAFKQLFKLIMDLKYVLIHLGVKNKYFEVQFVAGVRTITCSTMST